VPDTTVNLMWIGNRQPLLDPTPGSNISQTQANQIVGWMAEGKDEIKPVELTGDYYTSGGNHFKTTYQGTAQQPTSQFSYTDPAGDPQSGVTITTFVSARFAITVHDEDGNPSVVQQNGVLIQMSNGDLFFRPSASTVNDWDSITRFSKVEVLSATPIDNTVATIGFNADIFETDIVCFVRGTLIEFADGSRPIESLKVGDLVQTLDNGHQPLRWIGSVKLGASALKATPKLLPIRIKAGALGTETPSSDLLVSPQHRVLVRSKVALKMFGATEVLVAAKQLLQIEGVDVAEDLHEVEYFHLLFDRHEVVTSNGAPTESLYTGAQALQSVGQAAREEIFTLFPELREKEFVPQPARPLPSGRKARKLTVRHIEHHRPLVC